MQKRSLCPTLLVKLVLLTLVVLLPTLLTANILSSRHGHSVGGNHRWTCVHFQECRCRFQCSGSGWQHSHVYTPRFSGSQFPRSIYQQYLRRSQESQPCLDLLLRISARTPAQPGHVFDVTYDPVAGTAVWTSLEGSLGDIPITALVRDDATGDLYAANDFGVLRLPRGNTVWQTAARGLPKAEIPALSISTSARVLYAATHGRGAYVLPLPED